MKITKLLCTGLLFVAGSVFAEQFVIVNKSKDAIPHVKIKAESADLAASAIGIGKFTKLIDIGVRQLTYIAWLTGENEAYIVYFNGSVPLSSNQKNFFNIGNNGWYQYRFGDANVSTGATAQKIDYVQYANL